MKKGTAQMKSNLMRRKQDALNYFLSQLTSGELKRYIGKVYLFGSFVKGEARKDSDVDVLIFCNQNLKHILDNCARIQLGTYIAYSESIEPILYPIEKLRYPDSYFLYRIIKYGKEVYSMEEKEMKREEARSYLSLAEDYLAGAEENLPKRVRIALDTAYNAAELSAKALLFLVMDEIPSTHGGIVGEFGKFYIKTEKIPREVGHNLNKALDLRNKARYVWNAEIIEQDAKDVIQLAQTILKEAKCRV